MNEKFLDPEKILEMTEMDFQDTEFDQLMQKRILKVLIICNNYDNFMLEEDGRIDEQIFNEYMSLGLRYPPIFIRVNSAEKAFDALKTKEIDLVITMLNIKDVNVFQLAKKIKKQHHDIPIVVLTPFSQEVAQKIEKEDLSAIDYTFCWLGNPDILLAIIKLLEDKMNALNDIIEKGVQAVILVEDSIRYYSSMLPILYKIFFIQSQRSSIEGANEHQKNLRMRGRPKIMMATNYEEAVGLFNKYGENVIGVFSDVRYKINGKLDAKAGLKLAAELKKKDPNLPMLLLSSESENRVYADELGIDFIDKYTRNFSFKLRNYIIKNLHLGSFHFYCPKKNKIICTATSLKSFQELILKVTPESIEYHVKQNHFTKWLNSRALFLLARKFKHLRLDHFDTIEDVRAFVYQAVSNYRMSSGRGVITKFEQSTFDTYSIFSRIGDGYIGGKARSLAFTDLLIKKYNLRKKYDNMLVTIPRTTILCTDIFDEFMESNNLYDIALSDKSDEEILQKFVEAQLPNRIFTKLYSYISYTNNPIAIRSSSRLEDSHYQPFAGVYSTYMIPNITDNKHLTIELLTSAIKSVYASVFFKTSKSYMAATANVIDEEKMGIVLQDVCGRQYENFFFPTISGVARSINFYPVKPEKSEDGIVNLALGLGKHIVDGEKSLRYSPSHPKKILQLSTPDLTMRDSQKTFYALSLDKNDYEPSTKEDINIIKLKVEDAHDEVLRHVASTYDFQNSIIRDGIRHDGKKLITFANILKNNTLPINDILQEFLQISKSEMNNHVEMEFAVNISNDKDTPSTFNILQIRPIIESDQDVVINIDKIDKNDAIVYSEAVLGNGLYEGLRDIIYVKTEKFSSLNNQNMVSIIDKLNQNMLKENKNYVLIGPGRWGSSDNFLGIPVKWGNISAARIIIESGLENYRIEPSQGTHFFHNLTSFRVGYFTINPFINDGYYDYEYLNNSKAVYEDEYIRQVRFDSDLKIKLDGKSSKGVIYK